MKTLLKLLIVCGFCSSSLLAQQWTARTGLGNINKRTFSTSFSIAGKIYLVGGQYNFTGLSDVWEYDILLDTWTAKSAFPGGLRGGAVAFSIGGKGYFMCGSNYTGQYFEDVWEYNPGSDTWTQKQNFPGGKREEAVGFAIGSSGYLGTGYLEVVGPNSTSFITYSDFWQYDPVNDAWTQKTLFPGTQRGWAVGAAAAGKGYIGLGGNSAQTASFSDFYEYDPSADTWSAIASYGPALSDAMAFTINQEMYVCGGISFSTFSGSSVLKKYDAATNTWTTMSSMSGGITMGAVGVTANNRGFVGTGYTSQLTERSDWWEFVTTNTLCPGPIAYNTSTLAASGNQCNGQITISNILNGCAPYSVTVIPNTGSVVTLTGSGTSFSVTNLCAGLYTITVSDINGCCTPGTTVSAVPGSVATGIPEESKTGWAIYPNPNKGSFIYKMERPEAFDPASLQITTLLGSSIDFTWNRNGQDIEIELAQKIKGVYLFSCRDKEKTTFKRLVID